MSFQCTYKSIYNRECRATDTFPVEYETGGGWGSMWACSKHAPILKLQFEAEGYTFYLGEVERPKCGGTGKISELLD
jgi:hypothetical protein